MKKKNNVIILSLVLTVVFGVIIGSKAFEEYRIWNYSGGEKKEEIVSFFYEYKDIIEKSVKTKKYGEIRHRGIKSVENHDEYLYFVYYEYGIIPEGGNKGFIYSVNRNTDIFAPVPKDECEKVKTKSGYLYYDQIGDNHCYVEQIEENYYYYEQQW